MDYTDRVVRDKQYKVHVLDGKIAKLYDLKLDPAEEHNLVESQRPEHLAAKRKLSAAVATFPDKDGRPRYDPLPPQPWDLTRERNEKMWNKR
ncbi:MAG: hypothetical protein GY953_50285 [bacterium]|nr:hypothetical protein [bacterium]